MFVIYLQLGFILEIETFKAIHVSLKCVMICVDPKNDWCYADDSKVMIMHVIFTFKNLLHISTPQGY